MVAFEKLDDLGMLAARHLGVCRARAECKDQGADGYKAVDEKKIRVIPSYSPSLGQGLRSRNQPDLRVHTEYRAKLRPASVHLSSGISDRHPNVRLWLLADIQPSTIDVR